MNPSLPILQLDFLIRLSERKGKKEEEEEEEIPTNLLSRRSSANFHKQLLKNKTA
jgi:hypothetical protein